MLKKTGKISCTQQRFDCGKKPIAGDLVCTGFQHSSPMLNKHHISAPGLRSITRNCLVSDKVAILTENISFSITSVITRLLPCFELKLVEVGISKE